MFRTVLSLAFLLALAACHRVGPDPYRGLWQMSLTLDRGGAYFALVTIDSPIYVFEDGGGGVFSWCEDAGFTRCDSGPSGEAKVGRYMDELIATFSQNDYGVLLGRDGDGVVENGVIEGRGSLLERSTPTDEGDFRFERVGDTP